MHAQVGDAEGIDLFQIGQPHFLVIQPPGSHRVARVKLPAVDTQFFHLVFGIVEGVLLGWITESVTEHAL